MSEDKPKATELDIFGTVYRVRGDENREHLQELAAVVDGRMREIAEQVSTSDTTKVAVLAALNLADELFRCREGQEGERDDIKGRIEALTGTLAKALKSA